MHSLVVHPQEKADKPSASQSKETSSGASSATTTRESGITTEQSAGASSSKLNDRDTTMFKQIAESHLAEISAGKLAEEKASSNEVKSFAKKMVDDHTKALDDLKQLAQSKGVTLPTEANSQHMAAEKRLRALSGAKFDQQYMQQAGDRAHKDTHRLLQRAASRAEDTDLKNYASKAAGTVETHQQMAKETSRNLKSSAEGKSSGGREASGDVKGKSSGGGSPDSEAGPSAGGEDKGSGSTGTSK
jgi:putative membrane protein